MTRTHEERERHIEACLKDIREIVALLDPKGAARAAEEKRKRENANLLTTRQAGSRLREYPAQNP